MSDNRSIDLITMMDTFGSEDKCRDYLTELRWPDGVVCPRCGCTNISKIIKRDQYDCDGCRYQFSATAGTIFHDSHLPLRKWFAAVYLMCESRKGISANQLKRTLKVAYKTAWYLCHRIRAAVKDVNEAQLSGTVECDETYLGGRARGRGRGFTGHKQMVLGAIERGGDVRLKVDKRADRKTLHKFVFDTAHPDTEAIFTDGHAGYKGITDANTRHETVNHEADEWVRGDVHTNTIEGVFSLFKRSVVGSYHQISAKHLPAYLDEFEFRFNNRKNPYLFRDTLLKLIEAEKLGYRTLVASGS
ncbi:MAG: IS1595 family transposase [Candidatus Hydrogenedentes bacterium]|nr:IS1595 family transposase [Candidatus Hydrogenedentota bacterium]